MFQAMSRITKWLTRDTPTEGIEERTIRKSFLGKTSANLEILGAIVHLPADHYVNF